jgi:hypothetical protein
MNRLLRIAAFFTTAVTIFVCGSTVIAVWRVSKAARHPKLSHAVGDRVAALPGFDYSEHELTVLMPISRKCLSCDQTYALYRSIAEQVAAKPGYRVVWVTSEPPEAMADFIRAQRLPEARIISANPDVLRLAALPSVMAVDRTATIRGRWVGRSALQRAAEIRSFMSRPIPPAGPTTPF